MLFEERDYIQYESHDNLRMAVDSWDPPLSRWWQWITTSHRSVRVLVLEANPVGVVSSTSSVPARDSHSCGSAGLAGYRQYRERIS